MTISNMTIRERLGLRPIINVSGTMTTLGASIIVPEAISAMAEIASQWVEMDDLQRAASTVIARLTGGEAGFITACCASGITMAIAGAMTGTNLLAMERLPDDTEGLKSEVVIQLGHIVNYGAPIDQSIRVAGAKAIPAGTVSVTQDYHVREAINDRTAAALYVVAHHTVQYGMLSLEEFCEICHAKNIPVIVDAASEYDLRSFLARGADIVVYSGHKFLSGPTSGIVTGRKDLVRAAYLQNRGVARAMKVGKESIAGTMAALEAWEKRDHAGIRRREEAALNLWKDALQGIPGIGAQIIPDPTANPLDRLQVFVRPESRFTAAGLASALAAGSPPVIVRNHEVERGHFFLDPCNLHPGEAEIVAEQLRAILTAKERPVDAMKAARKDSAGALRWPD
ncbi:MAG: aminotransferase class V-fold PLP-dependent enzyme [Mesorhizobium sp.]|uniref:aminotransferase class V-fold PLP-dependent enzyme n=1 Tax=unclassified Mesorhizobium TaxID=325217 RepID=UPI000F764290|nr:MULTISPECIES: aminotransferase class V-fold PLP-dependent enzyme [unclassified Mesorhizobium]AZO73320.1 aminotransferase class V-fold PLP-dependent enzyme [Mesorhizobium sp. M1D.F.Ca.ET.043.01.1.1]RWA95822.1 MAG: aminotransferase class V-fold PLP-dependent enzyme [Mesorhizobium sp.]TJW87460.1 MAG: aminotransferase class V-fold PLP-dependent enzyme [Mesorhizobium sp.]